MYLTTKDSRRSPAESFLGPDRIRRQPWLAYSLDRFITSWGRYVENKLQEYEEDEQHHRRPRYSLNELLCIEEQAVDYSQTPLEDRRRNWEAQVAAARSQTTSK